MAARGLTDVHDVLVAGTVPVGMVSGGPVPELKKSILCINVLQFMLVYESCVTAILSLTFC
jgi:hypothetical protein